MKLLIVASHPIQYQAPLYRALAQSEGVDVVVAFGKIPTSAEQGKGFGVPFEWDIPLRDGYRSLVFGDALAGGLSARAVMKVGKRLIGILRDEKPDVVLVTGWYDYALVVALVILRFCGRPLLLRCDNNSLKKRRWVTRLLHRVLLSSFARVLPVGVANSRYYRELGVSDDRMDFAPHFVEHARFEQAGQELRSRRDDLRRERGIPEDAVCFLFCGKLIPKKRAGDLIEAIGGMDRAFGLIVGDGELRGGLERDAARAGSACTFVGFLNQSEIAAAYVAADVLVLPSDEGETWGLVVNEAMACGVPCVVSDRVGCREDLVVEGVTGWSYPCGDVSRLREILSALVAEPDQINRAGLAARGLVANYSPEAACAGVLAGVRGVVADDGE